MKGQEKSIIYKLLYQALIEIREESHRMGNNKIYMLSDLFHNVPLKLDNVRGNNDVQSLLDDIINDSESMGIKKWIDNVVSQL